MVGEKNLIFYVGYASFDPKNIYGSELALINLALELSKYYQVNVFGQMLNNDTINGINFYNSNIINDFYELNDVDVCIISRYINYLIEFPLKAKKTYIWLHDVCFHAAYNGVFLPDNGTSLVNNCLDKINGIITLTEWHKKIIINKHNISENKLKIIGNGINSSYFKKYVDFEEVKKIKIPYRFIYTSDVGRGLNELVEYFEDIVQKYPLAELHIYRDVKSFNGFGYLLEKINKAENIYYHGKLKQEQLIHEFIKSDIWLYPTTFTETYCMSGLEALRSGCYCITTNLAALEETIGDRGVLINGNPKEKNVKDVFLKEVYKAFSNGKKSVKQKEGFEWAKTKTWEYIGREWINLLNNNKEIINI